MFMAASKDTKLYDDAIVLLRKIHTGETYKYGPENNHISTEINKNGWVKGLHNPGNGQIIYESNGVSLTELGEQELECLDSKSNKEITIEILNYLIEEKKRKQYKQEAGHEYKSRLNNVFRLKSEKYGWDRDERSDWLKNFSNKGIIKGSFDNPTMLAITGIDIANAEEYIEQSMQKNSTNPNASVTITGPAMVSTFHNSSQVQNNSQNQTSSDSKKSSQIKLANRNGAFAVIVALIGLAGTIIAVFYPSDEIPDEDKPASPTIAQISFDEIYMIEHKDSAKQDNTFIIIDGKRINLGGDCKQELLELEVELREVPTFSDIEPIPVFDSDYKKWPTCEQMKNVLRTTP